MPQCAQRFRGERKYSFLLRSFAHVAVVLPFFFLVYVCKPTLDMPKASKQTQKLRKRASEARRTRTRNLQATKSDVAHHDTLAFEQLIPDKSLSGGTRCQIITYECHIHTYERRNHTEIFYYCHPSLRTWKIGSQDLSPVFSKL